MVNDTLSLHIYASSGKSALMDDFQTRAEVARLFSEIAESEAVLEEVLVYGSASPDGLWENNIVLSSRRAENVADYLVNEMGVHINAIRRIDLREDWNALYDIVRDSDLLCREQVMQIISSKAWDDRKRALSSLNDGMVWERLKEDFFPRLRYAKVMLICSKRVQKKELDLSFVEKPITEKAEVSHIKKDEAHVKSFLHVDAQHQPAELKKTYQMGFKTNLLSDMVALPSLGLEAQLTKYISLDISASLRNCNVVSPELRWWFGDQIMRQGSFVGLHANVSWFDIEWNDGKLYQAELGDAWSAGVTYGYSLGLGTLDRWGLEFVVGAGYLCAIQDVWEKNDHDVWQLMQHKHTMGIGLTKLGVNLTYRFSLKKYDK